MFLDCFFDLLGRDLLAHLFHGYLDVVAAYPSRVVCIKLPENGLDFNLSVSKVWAGVKIHGGSHELTVVDLSLPSAVDLCNDVIDVLLGEIEALLSFEDFLELVHAYSAGACSVDGMKL